MCIKTEDEMNRNGWRLKGCDLAILSKKLSLQSKFILFHCDPFWRASFTHLFLYWDCDACILPAITGFQHLSFLLKIVKSQFFSLHPFQLFYSILNFYEHVKQFFVRLCRTADEDPWVETSLIIIYLFHDSM